MIDYKKVFKSVKLRYFILNAASFLSDKKMIKIQYYIKTGRVLNLNNPIRYSEKMQWYKLFYRNPIMKECVDKWEVREFVKDRGLNCILNETYGVFNDPDEINWSLLPDKFIIKDTLGSGGRSIIIVEDKNSVDIPSINNQLKEWINTPIKKKNYGREWVYEGSRHRIIIEKLLIGNVDGDLPDYKFFCFDGKVFCSYMMENYTMHHDQGRLGFFDRDFVLLPVYRKDFKPITQQPPKPKNYSDMVMIAERLSEGFPHVRVDLYNLNGTIVFGEMTFFNASGYVVFEPDEFDYTMGNQFNIPDQESL